MWKISLFRDRGKHNLRNGAFLYDFTAQESMLQA